MEGKRRIGGRYPITVHRKQCQIIVFGYLQCKKNDSAGYVVFVPGKYIKISIEVLRDEYYPSAGDESARLARTTDTAGTSEG